MSCADDTFGRYKAAASVGIGEVLPGVDPVERNISETRDQIEQIRRQDATLFTDGGNAALSGEEYRRRLAIAFANDDTRRRILNLPWGTGTGFTREGATPGFVFCARIGDHPKPWYRYVPLNANMRVQTIDADGQPLVIDDTLACLAHADPSSETVTPVLEDRMYDAAFDAWAAAQQHIYAQWMHQTDPANLALWVPKTSSVLVTAILIANACQRDPGWFQRADLGDVLCRVLGEDDRLCCCDWRTSV